MKKLVLFLVLISVGCSNKSPNKIQVENTYKNLDCYKEMINTIRKDSIIPLRLLDLRKKKKQYKKGKLYINKQALLSYKEIYPIFNKECLDSLQKDNSLKGVRFFDGEIVLEINSFKRRTLTEKYSKYSTLEIHRLTTFENPPKGSLGFYTKDLVWNYKINDSLFYQVHQYKLN